MATFSPILAFAFSTLFALTCPICAHSAVEDITTKYSEPIGAANTLLYDLDRQIESIISKQLPRSSSDERKVAAEEQIPLAYAFDQAEASEKLKIIAQKPISTNTEIGSDGSVSSNSVDSALSPKQQQQQQQQNASDENNAIGSLLINLGQLDKRLQETFHDLQARRRYVLGAMIRQMQSTVRRIRSNVSRMQVQMSTIEVVATRPPIVRSNVNGTSTNNSTTIATITAANIAANKVIIDEIRKRIHRTSNHINEIVARLNSSLGERVESLEPESIASTIERYGDLHAKSNQSINSNNRNNLKQDADTQSVGKKVEEVSKFPLTN